MSILNQNQRLAAEHRSGPMMVLAGPGSGKTTTIIYRLLKLINNKAAKPDEIFVITFTKAAAEEMKTRFMALWGGGKCPVAFGTFHSFFYRILRSRYNYPLDSILKDDQKKGLLINISRHFNISMEDEEDFLQGLINEISLIKNELMDIKFYNSTTLGADDFKNIFEVYEAYKKKHRLLDFDDMLVQCYRLLTEDEEALSRWREKYPFIMIDEFQDINRVQYESIKLLSKPRNNVFVVGDDDQSIYKFRGARPEFFLQFPNDYPDTETVTLDINYRSTDPIISLCNKVIAENKQRYGKQIAGTGREGPSPQLIVSEDIGNEAMNIAKRIRAEKKSIDYSDTAVIYRVNIQARAFVDAFMDLNIPFKIKDRVPTIYEHWIAKDLLAYLRLSLDPGIPADLERIINKPARYIQKAVIVAARRRPGSLMDNLYSSLSMSKRQKAALENLEFCLNAIGKRTTYEAIRYIRKGVDYDQYVGKYAAYRKMKPVGFYEILDELQESAKVYQSIPDYLEHVEQVIKEAQEQIQNPLNEKNGVLLSTMHSAKGLEFGTVFIAGVVEGLLPYEKSRTEAEIEEERRLLYVGMTRAKTRLYLSVLKTRYEAEVKPSRFLPLKSK